VSAFGFSGSNAHVILEEAPARPPAAPTARPVAPPLPVVLSARSEPPLRAQARQLRAHLDAHPELALGDVAYSLAVTRSQLRHRAAIVAGDRDGLRAELDAPGDGHRPSRGDAARPADGKLALLFTGQGSQRLAMGRPLYEAFPVF